MVMIDVTDKDDNDNTAKCKLTTTSNSELGKDFVDIQTNR